MSDEPPRLHVVTNRQIAQRPDLANQARRIGIPGVAVHARAPDLEGYAFLRFAQRLAESVATLFVNDRADVACLLHARGLHLPERGLPYAAARRLVGDRWLGRSVHDPAAARKAAEEGFDYVFLGPIWPTPSHPDRTPLGVEAIAASQPARVIAIGGVTPKRVAECVAAGAYGVAAISAVWDAAEPGSVVGAMLVSLRQTGTEGRANNP